MFLPKVTYFPIKLHILSVLGIKLMTLALKAPCFSVWEDVAWFSPVLQIANEFNKTSANNMCLSLQTAYFKDFLALIYQDPK